MIKRPVSLSDNHWGELIFIVDANNRTVAAAGMSVAEEIVKAINSIPTVPPLPFTEHSHEQWEADCKAARDAAATTEVCGDEFNNHRCKRPKGHLGRHEEAEGVWWGNTPPIPEAKKYRVVRAWKWPENCSCRIMELDDGTYRQWTCGAKWVGFISNGSPKIELHGDALREVQERFETDNPLPPTEDVK